jgi:hypothetical protein
MNHYESLLAIIHHADPPVVAPLRQRLRVALATAELVAAHGGHPEGFQRQSTATGGGAEPGRNRRNLRNPILLIVNLSNFSSIMVIYHIYNQQGLIIIMGI